MEPGWGNRVATVLFVAVCLAAGGFWVARDARAARTPSDCASLGSAADFAVFSDGAFHSTGSGGTSITGRIAAAGDIKLDGISVGPAAGDAPPTIIGGAAFTAGRTSGAGGSVSGGVTYGGTSDVAPNFTVNGGLTRAPPPFSFDAEFTSLKNVSSSLAGLPQSAGASVSLNPFSHALELTGTEPDSNVFTVDAAQLAQAQGVVINLTQPGATALINVTTDTRLSIAPMYMSLAGSATAAGILWNLPLATARAGGTPPAHAAC